jgi:hypothetical protein
MTLAEHDAQLKAEGRYDAVKEAERVRQAEHQRRVDELHVALVPLLEDLEKVGVTSSAELSKVGAGTKEPPFPLAALPILIDHLGRRYPTNARRLMARAVAVPQSQFAWQFLVDAYRREPAEGAKDDLAVAVEAVADEGNTDDLIALVRERANGPSRILLLKGLVRLSDPRTKATLREMRHDPDLEKEIAVLLRRLDKKNH